MGRVKRTLAPYLLVLNPDTRVTEGALETVCEVLDERETVGIAGPKLVLANQPSRGLDVGATAEVHRRLLEARGRGAAIVLISEDLDELLALSDRIAVLYRGRLTEAVPVGALSARELGLAMAGNAIPLERAAA